LDFPKELEVVIEVPRGSFIKRNDRGEVDFVSPVPCPFNYGSVPDTVSGDGDRVDALVLGPALALGTRLRRPVVGCVRFVDAGLEDPKFVCSAGPLSAGDRLRIKAFFVVYAQAKRALNRARGKQGETRFDGIEEL
jgi:inorganic pyrophosphatase